MLSEEQYLLVCLMEECNEVSQRVSKALRFGLDEIQPGQELTNGARIQVELDDLYTTVFELDARGNTIGMPMVSEVKRAKIAKFMDYSRQQGVCA